MVLSHHLQSHPWLRHDEKAVYEDIMEIYVYMEIYGSRGHLQDILLIFHMVDLLEADDVVEAENLDFFFGQTNYYYSLLSFIGQLQFIFNLL